MKDVRTDGHTYGHCDLETNSAQRGRFGENFIYSEKQKHQMKQFVQKFGEQNIKRSNLSNNWNDNFGF